MSNMKLYVSDIVQSYKDIIMGHLGNVGTEDLLLHVVQFLVCMCSLWIESGSAYGSVLFNNYV